MTTFNINTDVHITTEFSDSTLHILNRLTQSVDQLDTIEVENLQKDIEFIKIRSENKEAILNELKKKILDIQKGQVDTKLAQFPELPSFEDLKTYSIDLKYIVNGVESYMNDLNNAQSADSDKKINTAKVIQDVISGYKALNQNTIQNAIDSLHLAEIIE